MIASPYSGSRDNLIITTRLHCDARFCHSACFGTGPLGSTGLCNHSRRRCENAGLRQAFVGRVQRLPSHRWRRQWHSFDHRLASNRLHGDDGILQKRQPPKPGDDLRGNLSRRRPDQGAGGLLWIPAKGPPPGYTGGKIKGTTSVAPFESVSSDQPFFVAGCPETVFANMSATMPSYQPTLSA